MSDNPFRQLNHLIGFYMLGNQPKPETASQLADSLTPFLEALANIHYLLDLQILNPPRLRELRIFEEEVFEELVKCVRNVSIPAKLSAAGDTTT